MAQVETVAGSILARSSATASAAMTENLVATLHGLMTARHIGRVAATEDKDSEPVIGRLDGGVGAAFDSAIIRTLDTIEGIVSDKRLWRPRRGATDKLTRADLRARLARLDRGAVRPSTSMARHLQLSVTAEGRACVFAPIPGGGIAGVGRTFEEALSDFDESFKNRPPLVDAGPANSTPVEKETE